MQKPEPDSIPLSPGVYLYKDAKGKIIYVGKARVLRRRVLSYFRPSGLPSKTVAMLARAQSIEYMVTNTESEALLLEASLIKKHRPRYNIVLRDDKQYALFRLDLKKEFPRLEITRKVRRDGARYFGPFTSSSAARETWKLLHRAFALRRCSDRMMKNRVRACLYHHIGQCQAPCMGEISPEKYAESARKVCEALSGHAEPLLFAMRSEMAQAAEELDFERAAELRDQIKAIERTVERQAAILPGARDVDAIGLHQSEQGLALGILFARNGAVVDSRAFYWSGLGYEDAPELLLSFLNQFYAQVFPPPRILLPWFPDAAGESQGYGAPVNIELPGQSMEVEKLPTGGGKEIVADNLEFEDFMDTKRMLEQLFGERRGGVVRIVVPHNAADNRLVDMAQANAREEARRRRGNDAGVILEKIAAAMKLKAPPGRIECVDVSHISGKQTRVGMVVYEDGLPSKPDFRIYSMPDSQDDYATLYAWVARRIESGPPWPDLLLIDGGRGQLASVAKGLSSAGQDGLFPLAAIAKARNDEGHADRRAGNVADRIFVPGRSNPLPFKNGSPELLFLQQIRDATHHFAIQGHRRARKSVALSGELMRLPGVGPATARLLWDKFGSVEAMRSATENELLQIDGIGRARARMLVEKLRSLA